MTNIPANILDDAVGTLLTAREFCGDGRTACLDMLASDHGIKGQEAVRIYRRANFEANKVWNRWQREAGVPEKYLF